MDDQLRREVNLLHANICQALADPKRILILYALGREPQVRQRARRGDRLPAVDHLAPPQGAARPAARRDRARRRRGALLARRRRASSRRSTRCAPSWSAPSTAGSTGAQPRGAAIVRDPYRPRADTSTHKGKERLRVQPEQDREAPSSRELFGDRVTFEQLERRLYGHDIAAIPSLVKPLVGDTTPDAVVQPTSEAELVEFVKWADEHRIPLTPRGKGSSGYGGAIPVKNGVVVDFYRMKDIVAVDEDALTGHRPSRASPGSSSTGSSRSTT